MFNIALNTFREIIRNRILYIIVFFAVIFIVFSIALGQLSLGQDSKVIVDFGLAMIEIFGLISVLFVGSQLLFKEIEGKTIFLILSKPIRRYEFILGKFLGFSGVIGLITFFQSLLFILLLLSKSISIDFLILVSLLFTFFKLEITLGLVFFFSTFMSTILTILVSIMVYILGHSYGLILDLVDRIGNRLIHSLVAIFQLLFPPFEALNTKDVIGMFDSFPPYFFVFNSAYSLLYLVIILGCTIFIFEKKSFES